MFTSLAEWTEGLNGRMSSAGVRLDTLLAIPLVDNLTYFTLSINAYLPS